MSVKIFRDLLEQRADAADVTVDALLAEQLEA
jgi:hypothetical protein